MQQDAVAIVLGRAGSKGVPGKNTRSIAGKPCAAWTIEHAMETSGVRTVVVSTDSPQLKTIAAAMGAAVVERPDELANDTATVDDAARHALGAVAQEMPWTIDPKTPVLVLYANVPVRPADLCERALARLAESGCDSVQSYERVGKHHPWWMVRLDVEAGYLSPWEGEVLNHGVHRRQDLPPAYLPDGGVIAVTREALMLDVAGVDAGPHAFFGADRRGIVSESGTIVDIDEEIDVVRAEAMLLAPSPSGERAGERGLRQ